MKLLYYRIITIETDVTLGLVYGLDCSLGKLDIPRQLVSAFYVIRMGSGAARARPLLWSQASNKSLPIEWNHDSGIDQKLDTHKQPRASLKCHREKAEILGN